jgi:hypothetical protein
MGMNAHVLVSHQNSITVVESVILKAAWNDLNSVEGTNLIKHRALRRQFYVVCRWSKQ